MDTELGKLSENLDNDPSSRHNIKYKLKQV